jgi:hypothetical protein
MVRLHEDVTAGNPGAQLHARQEGARQLPVWWCGGVCVCVLRGG